MKAAPASQPVAAAKKAVASGGSSLVDEDTGTTVGELATVSGCFSEVYGVRLP